MTQPYSCFKSTRLLSSVAKMCVDSNDRIPSALTIPCTLYSHGKRYIQTNICELYKNKKK